MLENVSSNCCEPGGRTESPGLPGEGGARPSGSPRPPWVAPALAAVLIVTTVVDVLGNLLVILSVGRNRKLRNTGERNSPLLSSDGPLASGFDPRSARSGSSLVLGTPFFSLYIVSKLGLKLKS